MGVSGLLAVPAVFGGLAVFLLGAGRFSDSLLRRQRRRFVRLLSGGGESRAGRAGAASAVSRRSAQQNRRRHHAFAGEWHDNWNGFWRGTAAGALSGVPSAGVVLLVSLVDSGQVRLRQAAAILLGINLGATVFAWYLAVFGYQAVFAGSGLILLALALPYVVGSGGEFSGAAELLLGIGLTLLGTHLLGWYLPAAADWLGRDADWQLSVHSYLMRGMSALPAAAGMLLGAAAVGAVTAALLRSFPGAVVLAMSLSATGLTDIWIAVGITTGAGIGMSLTGFLAARRLGAAARSTARLNLLLNCGAALWMFLLLFWLVPAAASLVPGVSNGAAALQLALLLSIQHSLNAVLLLPAAHRLGRRFRDAEPPGALVSVGAAGDAAPAGLRLVPSGLPEALESNLLHTQRALAEMADAARAMLMTVMNVSQLSDSFEDQLDQIQTGKMQLTTLRNMVSQALTRAVQSLCSPEQAETIQQQQRIAHELKGVGDDCYRIMLVFSRSYRKKYRFHDESDDELFGFSAQVLDFLQYNSDYLQGRLLELDPDVAEQMEAGINAARDVLKKRSRRVIEQQQDAHVKGELAFIEIVGHLEHIGDCCLHISRTVRRLQKVRL
ncbi:Na+/phosphate symporter [Spirochaeta africana]|uniref:Na+/phosphate symporter n=1 Tax=Spirochaeta africana (strain ATCC 700263 / DSM 8902 / Z-7692) TaxID=889378 RepID=H9UGU8_SPIAZ|nr:Na+/phosphate symporter [Spirochaeta africana]AFG36741.1 Na+/phosphate symporter [Spirochaeta africana DSM 8902]